MSSSKLPKSWGSKIDSWASKFFPVGNSSIEKVVSSNSQDPVCSPKAAGGLGLRRIEDMSKAFLQLVLISASDRVWVKAFKVKYFPLFTFMLCTKRKSSYSWLWGDILMVRPFLAKGVYFKIGKGELVDVWKDSQIPNIPTFHPVPRVEDGVFLQEMVNSLIDPGGTQNIMLLQALFDPKTVLNIKRMFQANSRLDDKIIWLPNGDGSFYVKSLSLCLIIILILC